MAIPSDIANLRFWYKADAEAYSNGDAVGTWNDQSGNGYHATQSTAGYKPTFVTNILNGKPALLFDGVDDRLANATVWGTLFPTDTHTFFAVFRPRTINQAWTTYKGGESLISEATACCVSFGVWTSSGLPKLGTVWRGNLAEFLAESDCPANAWRWGWSRASPGGYLYNSLDGGPEATTYLGTNGATYTGATKGGLAIGYNPASGAGFAFDGYIAELWAYSTDLAAADRLAMAEYIRSKYFPATAAQTEQVRDAISRRLWFRRRAGGMLQVTAPLWAMDLEIGDRVWVESPFGPDAAGAGWGPKRWQKRPFTLQSIEPDPTSDAVALVLRDLRPFDALLWDTGWTRRAGHGTKADGVARFGVGGARTFTRASRAWASNPADGAQVVGRVDSEPMFSYDGETFEPAATNEITRSSFVSGTTGLTVVAGSGGSAAVDSTVLLFHPDVAPQSFKLVGGTTESSVAFPATASLTGSLRVSIDHYDDSNGALGLRIYDGTNYWNDSAGTWGALVTNTLPVTQSMAATRWMSKAMSVTGKAITVTAVVTVNGRTCHVFHGQVEVSPHATSRIVTDGATGTRAKTRLLIENNSGKRCVSAAQGTFLAEVIPDWDAADIGNTNRCIAYAYHDASNYFLVQYNGTSDRFEFVVNRAGSTSTAYLAQAVTRGTAYKIAARWTGVEAELGLSAYTISVFVNGTKGTDATMAGAVSEVATANLEIGSKADAENWGGVVRRRLSRPYPMSDAEVGRFEA